jgi:hypothetical protein
VSAETYNAILGATLEVRQMIGNVERTSMLSQNYTAPAAPEATSGRASG